MSSKRTEFNALFPNAGLFTLTCQHIQHEANNVKTYIFNRPNNSAFQFMAGQHLKFRVVIDSQEHYCCYTIASSPSLEKYIKLTIKRLPHGKVSNYFHDEFSVGDSIEAEKPQGNFFLPQPCPKKLLLISAGSGITPMLSMLRFVVSQKTANQVVFVHSAQTELDLIAREEINALAKQHGNCQIMYTLTQSAPNNWQGYQGRLNEGMLNQINSLNQFQVFVCGPTLFRETVQNTLKAKLLPRSHYHYESFGERAKAAPTTQQDNSLSIFFTQWQKHIHAHEKKSILEQAELAGMSLPYSCRAGSCGACKAKLEEGQVKQLSSQALTKSEQQQGYILPCCCLPLTNLVINHGVTG